MDTRTGLLASLLGNHPTAGNGGGGGSGGGGGGQQGRTNDWCCCLRRRQNKCPVADEDDYDDYDFDLDPRKTKTPGTDGIGTRIVNVVSCHY